VPAKRRSTNVKAAVGQLTSFAYDKGVLPAPLNELIDLITIPSHLDQASLASIARNLYPATRLSSEIVLRVVGCLGHGKLKPSLPMQAALLRWLVMVYHILDDTSILSKSYAVLFNLLDTSAIR
jgi:centromere protein I